MTKANEAKETDKNSQNQKKMPKLRRILISKLIHI